MFMRNNQIVTIEALTFPHLSPFTRLCPATFFHHHRAGVHATGGVGHDAQEDDHQADVEPVPPQPALRAVQEVISHP